MVKISAPNMKVKVSDKYRTINANANADSASNHRGKKTRQNIAFHLY